MTYLHSSLTERIGVIDIGSNSVRLVVYDALKRVPMPLFNEKVLCGLARNFEHTHRLNAEGVKLAEQAITRFLALTQAMRVKTLYIVATAAVRDAVDGEFFVRKLEEKHQVSIRIFSGEEEAKFASFGIKACIPEARGLVADLGGGSLEIALLDHHKVTQIHSFPIGLLRLLSATEGDKKKARAIVDEHLLQIPSLKKMIGQPFYAVGGGFRNLAKIHIGMTNYPLRILHHYQIPTRTLLPLLQKIAEMDAASLLRMPHISGKRAETLPYTALILERIIALSQPSSLIFSAYGIREGLLFSLLSEKERQKDPLIASCADMVAHIQEGTAYGEELLEWMDPLFLQETPAERRLRYAACVVSGIARYEHTEYRAEIAFRRFLDSAVVGIDHEERLFIARALYHRYKSTPDKTILGITDEILEEKEIFRATLIGHCMRLGYNIAAGGVGFLPRTALFIQGKNLVLNFSPTTWFLMGESVQKKLQKLADLLDLSPRIACKPEEEFRKKKHSIKKL